MSTKMLAWKPDPKKWNVREVVPDIVQDPTGTSTIRNDFIREINKITKKVAAHANDVLDSLTNLFQTKMFASDKQYEISKIEMQAPQDDKTQRLLSAQTSGWVKSTITDFVRISHDRGVDKAKREEGLIRVPVQKPEVEERRFTPRERVLQETLAGVTTDQIVSLHQKYLADVKRTIDTGLVNGAPRKEVAAQITKLTGNLQWQSERIVRTELIRAFNTAQKMRFQADGIEYIQWVASAERDTRDVKKGTRTCELCWQLNGMITRIGEPFMVHKGSIIRLPPDSHPNCRCTIRPATTKDYDEFMGFHERSKEVTPEFVDMIIHKIRSVKQEDLELIKNVWNIAGDTL